MTAPEHATRGSATHGLFHASCLGGLVLLLGYAALTLARSPCLGVADIQDFWRVMKPAGIEHLSELEAPGYYTRCEFRTTGADLLSAPSSSALLAWFARFVPAQTSAESDFALRQMGLLNLAIMALIVAGGLAIGLRPILALALLYVLVDPGYLLFFNSFYADAALFLALLGSTIWLERTGDLSSALWKSGLSWAMAWIAALAGLALLGGGSKMQYFLLPALLLATLAPSLFRAAKPSWPRSFSVAATLAVVSLLVAWNFFLGPGPRFLEFNNYHAVYGGILRVASDPAHVLDKLGIPTEYKNLPRTDVWSAGVGSDHPVHQHLRKLSRLRLLELYLRDPQAMAGVAAAANGYLLAVESHPRGTYEKAPGDRSPVRRTYQVGWQFSRWTRALLRLWPAAIAAIPLIGAAWLAAWVGLGRWNGRRSAMLFLLLWVVSQFAAAVLGEGLVNLHQHLLGARLGFDFLMILLVADLLSELSIRTVGKQSGPR